MVEVEIWSDIVCPWCYLGKRRFEHALTSRRERQDHLVERPHRTYFTEQASIFGQASLTELAADVGLDRDEVSAVLAGDAYDDAVAADEAMARSLGAAGAPSFVIDRRYGISGAQPAQTIAEVFERAWADSEATAS
jgi:predicted DsbA family dithiol-disulfide isomerase